MVDHVIAGIALVLLLALVGQLGRIADNLATLLPYAQRIADNLDGIAVDADRAAGAARDIANHGINVHDANKKP